MGLDGLGGDGKLFADLFVGKLVKAAQLKDLPALRGQLFYGCQHQAQVFFPYNPFILYGGPGDKSIGKLLRVADLLFAEQVDQDAFSDPE